MIKISCCPIIFLRSLYLVSYNYIPTSTKKIKKKMADTPPPVKRTISSAQIFLANISSGKQSQHNTAGNRRTKHACQIRPHSVHEKKYIPAFLLPYKMRNAGSNWYGRNTC